MDSQSNINIDDVDESVSYEERCLCKIILGKPVLVRSLEMKIKIKEIKQVTSFSDTCTRGTKQLFLKL